MYTLALAIFIGLLSAQITNLVSENISFIQRIPFINKHDNFFIVVTILITWLTGTSLLGAYGISNNQEWIDVIGSAIAIVGLTNIVDAVTSKFVS